MRSRIGIQVSSSRFSVAPAVKSFSFPRYVPLKELMLNMMNQFAEYENRATLPRIFTAWQDGLWMHKSPCSARAFVWASEELNLGPHAYQACALTT
jgi:hypothetical protein